MTGCLTGSTESAGMENVAESKMQGRKTQDWKMLDQNAVPVQGPYFVWSHMSQFRVFRSHVASVSDSFGS